MQVAIETTSSIGRRLTIVIPANEIDQAVDSRLQKTAQTVRLKGFRQGKVPMKVVRSQFGAETRDEVLSELVRQNYIKAIEQEALNPAGFPEIVDQKNEIGQDFEFTAELEVYPEIHLQPLGDITITRPQAEILDQDVEETIENLRQQAAEYISVERAAKLNDQVIIDFEGFINDEAFEGGKGEKHPLILGSKSFIAGFEEQLIGTIATELRQVKVTFPQDYQVKQLADKEAVFKVKIHEVKEQTLPELDTEFIQRYGVENGDLAELKVQVKQNLQFEFENSVDNYIKQQVLDALIAVNPIEIPKALIQQEVDVLKRQAVQQLGLDEKFDIQQIPNNLFFEQARTRVQIGLLLADYLKQHKIEANDEEIRQLAEKLTRQQPNAEEIVNQYLADEQLKTQLRSAVLENKAVAALLEQTQLVDATMLFKEAIKLMRHNHESANNEVEHTDNSAVSS